MKAAPSYHRDIEFALSMALYRYLHMLHSLEARAVACVVKVALPGRLTGLTVDTSLTTCATRGVTDAHVSISLGQLFYIRENWHQDRRSLLLMMTK